MRQPAGETADAPVHRASRRLALVGGPALLAALAALNLVLTFGLQWLPVTAVGVGPATDALFVSALVPQVLLAVVSSGLTSVLTPLLATAGERAFSLHAWTYAYGVGLVALALNGALFLAAPIGVSWLAPGFDAPGRALTIDLFRIQLVGAFATMLLMVTWSAHYAKDRFAWVEVTGVLAGAAALAAAWLAVPSLGVVAVAWAMSLRAVLQVVLLAPGLGRFVRADFRAAGLNTLWRRLLPLVGGATYFKLDPVVERLLASFAPAGHLSLFHLGQLAYGAGNQIVTRALINTAMPRLAALAEQKTWPAFREVLHHRLFAAGAVTVAAWVALVVVGRPVLRLALSRWLDPGQVDTLHALLIGLGGVWLGGAAGQVLTTGFFAAGNTETPTRIGIIGFTVAIPLKIVCFRWWGIYGLAIATSAYTVGTACAHYVYLHRTLSEREAGEAA